MIFYPIGFLIVAYYFLSSASRNGKWEDAAKTIMLLFVLFCGVFLYYVR